MRTAIRLLYTVLVLMLFISASASAQTKHLFAVVITGTPQDIQDAIDKGADVNASNGENSPLILAAAYNKNPMVISTLLKAGAYIETRDPHHGGTALLWAAAWNPNAEAISILLNAGADINARDTLAGRTALMWAAVDNENPEIIMALLKAGADATARDKDGKTALYYAGNKEKLQGTDALKKLEEASK